MSGLTRYITIRLLSLVAAMFIVSVVAFILLRLMPGDPASAMLPPDAQLWEYEALRERLGLNAPVYVQFGRYLTRIVQFDFGNSLFYRLPVTEVIPRKIEATFLLAVVSMVVAILVGIPIGVIAAALVSVSIPNFWLGLMLILFFAVERGWLPVTGWRSLSEDPVQTLRFVILPAITMGTAVAASIARMTRSSMLEVLSLDYVRTGEAKGAGRRAILYKHSLRNAIIPVLATIGLSFSGLLGGAAVTETVFTIPGLGAWMVDSVGRRDFPVLETLLLLFAVINLVVHLLIDLVYLLIDPRVQYS